MEGSYIKLSRSILEWEWYQNVNVSKMFFHMLLKANWKDGKFENMIVPRGSFVSSYPRLSTESGLTVSEIRTALKHLEKSQVITVKSHAKYSVFTVNNYCLYQEVDSQIAGCSQAIDSQLTVKSQAVRRQLATIEEKKESNNISLSVNTRMESCTRFNKFWGIYPKKANMLNAQGEYMRVLETTAELTEDTLILAAGNYAESCRIRRTKEQYMKNPENWLRESVWMDYLPENYKKPEAPQKEPAWNADGRKKNQFNNFPQRSYDYDDLERQLLNVQSEG